MALGLPHIEALSERYAAETSGFSQADNAPLTKSRRPLMQKAPRFTSETAAAGTVIVYSVYITAGRPCQCEDST